MQLRKLALLLLAPVVVFAAAVDDLEFMAVMVTPTKTSALLKNKATNRTSWVDIGGTYGGYKSVSFNPTTEMLTLNKNGVVSQLQLKTKGKVQAATTPAPITPEQERAVLNNLRQLSAAADQYFLENGVSRVAIADLVGPEAKKYIRAINPVAGEDYSGMLLEQGKETAVTLPSGQKMSFKN